MGGFNIAEWVSNYGFPAAFAIYLLIRIEPAIKELTKTVNLLSIVVARSNGDDIEQIKRDFGGGK